MSTTALILAAGRGSRLGSHTAPKCPVEFAGQSLLAHQWRALRHTGVDDIHVITGYRAADIESLGNPTVHNPSFATTKTNMMGSLFCARERMVDTADLMIVYGDLGSEPRIVRALSADGDILELGGRPASLREDA